MSYSGLLGDQDHFSTFQDTESVLIVSGVNDCVPLVSIMIPTYKRPELLKASIRSALRQNTSDLFEVVVIDNDPDSDIVSEVNALIRGFDASNLWLYRNQANIGMFGNWNRCLTLARGAWVTILNDDDMLDEGFISRCLAGIAENRQINLIACKHRELDEREVRGSFLYLRRFARGIQQLVKRRSSDSVDVICTEDYFLRNLHRGSLGILMRRKLALSIGGFNTSLFPSADMIFFVRFQLRYGSHMLSQILSTTRVSVNESMSSRAAQGWIHQGLRLRDELIEIIGCCKWLLRIYSKMLAIETANYCVLFWGSTIDVKKLLDAEGISHRSVFISMQILRIVIGLLFKIKKYKYQKGNLS
jgi:glycosyltransferase involved in cell wall biosynthesis